jgi:hypothetical protein
MYNNFREEKGEDRLFPCRKQRRSFSAEGGRLISSADDGIQNYKGVRTNSKITKTAIT